MNLFDIFNSNASGYASSAYLAKLAKIESGGNPLAQSPYSSAGGLFQFVDSTWAGLGGGNRFDPTQATQRVVTLTNQNASYLSKLLGRNPTEGELYLAHQQGASGAAKLLSNPLAKAVDLLGSDQVLNNGGTFDMTAGEFASLWTSKFGDAHAANDAAAETSIGGNSIATYFVRGAVILTGFIFLAVGLAMFKPAMAILQGTPISRAAKGLQAAT